jgi:hypothetical protein
MRQLIYAMVFLLLIVSCRDKVICPTFQSTYILDDSVRTTYFSYLWYLDEEERQQHLAGEAKTAPQDTDSLDMLVASADNEQAPVDYFAYTSEYKAPLQRTRKTKYGVIKEPIAFTTLIRNIRMKTGPRQNVLTPPMPSAEEETENLMAMDSTQSDSLSSVGGLAADSLATDSTAVAQTPEEKADEEWERFKYGFVPRPGMHPDQDYYYKKYGWLLQNARPEPDTTQNAADSLMADSTSQRGFLGIFKNKKKADSTSVEDEKKGPFGFFGRKRKKKAEREPEDESTPENNDAAEKPEDENE